MALLERYQLLLRGTQLGLMGVDGGGGREYSGVMSEGKPVLVSVMYSPKARMTRGSVHRSASGRREETSFSRRSRAMLRAGQVRMACAKVSRSVPHRGQVGSGFSSNHEVCAARELFAARI